MSALAQHRTFRGLQQRHDRALPPDLPEVTDPRDEILVALATDPLHAKTVPFIDHTKQDEDRTTIIDVMVEAIGNDVRARQELVCLIQTHPELFGGLRSAAGAYHSDQHAADLAKFRADDLFDWQEAV